MKPWIMAVLITGWFFAGSSMAQEAPWRIYDIEQGAFLTLSEALPELRQNRVIVIGEHHNNQSHHQAQLAVIQALSESDTPVAVGLEMFQRESQSVLDRWVAGDLKEPAFKKAYFENWSFSWPLYAPIFHYARGQGIPLIGLNVPRDITRQVSRKGFGSLNSHQRGKLQGVACRVDEAYMNYIRRAYGGHGHGNMRFEYFCEAQLVWDNVMAIEVVKYLDRHPDSIVVALTGTGHAQKPAMPEQIKSRSRVSLAVILPWVDGSVTAETIGLDTADYLIFKGELE